MTSVRTEAERIRSKDNASGCARAMPSASEYSFSCLTHLGNCKAKETRGIATRFSGLGFAPAKECFDQMIFSLLTCEASIAFPWTESRKIQGDEKRKTKQVVGICWD